MDANNQPYNGRKREKKIIISITQLPLLNLFILYLGNNPNFLYNFMQKLSSNCLKQHSL